MNILFLNTGGTIGMKGEDRTSFYSLEELLENINISKRHKVKQVELRPPRDSTNLMMSDRIKMAKIIKRNYDECDAFIIIHGTDSLADTTSVLSLIFGKSCSLELGSLFQVVNFV